MKINAILHRPGEPASGKPPIGLRANVAKRRNGPPVQLGSEVTTIHCVNKQTGASSFKCDPVTGLPLTYLTVMLPTDLEYRAEAMRQLREAAGLFWDCDLVVYSTEDPYETQEEEQ